jgi:hypothetical protein
VSSSTPPPETTISTELLTRILVGLIAVWSLLAGLALVFFQGAGSGAMGAGTSDPAGQRLLGAHLIILAPVYALLAWRTEDYHGLIWLPFVSQLAVFFAVGYSILIGDTDFGDGVIALSVSGIFIGLLGFVWISEQRTLARMRFEEQESHIDWLDDQTALDEPSESTY